ncbi:MAG: zf-HC2 domain-containing protein [Thermosediminibacteraceae bacterium]|nr:zf-HC2 domain-containing protein [Thermosediminibacteraceae bacterium]
MCYDEGMLQAYLDGELNEKEEKRIKAHLASCRSCEKLLRELKDLGDFAKNKLALDFNPPEDSLKKRYKYLMIKKGAQDIMKKYGKLVAAFMAVLVISSAIWFAPVRDAVADFLSIFRLSKIEAVKITPEDLEQIKHRLNESGIKEIDLEQLGKVRATGGGFEEVKPEDIALVFEKVAFEYKPLKAPEGFELTFVGIEKPQRIEITPKVDGMNQLISALGGTKLLPKELDGKTFVVTSKGIVRQSYVNEGVKSREFKSFVLSQIGAPEIHVPEGVDLTAVREAVLELPFLPENIRQQLYGIEDWQTTMPIPVDTEHADTEEITVNGKPGLLVKRTWGDNAVDYTIIWTEDQTIFVLEGNLPAQELLQIAASLR